MNRLDIKSSAKILKGWRDQLNSSHKLYEAAGVLIDAASGVSERRTMNGFFTRAWESFCDGLFIGIGVMVGLFLVGKIFL